MTDQDFEFVRRLIQERSAIVLEPGKEYLVESRLSPIVRQRNLGSVGDLVAHMRTQSAANGLYTQVVEAMVTTETSFFRDMHPFEALRKTVIPDLIKKRQAERRLNIWCAACSSGQEPYSVAMLLREHFPELLAWQVKLIASDLSGEMLNRAREGRFNQIEINRGLPASLMVKYFEQQGTDWQISSALRESIDFRAINLAQTFPPMPLMDLVMIRNVMIYFEVPMKKAILGKVAGLLRHDGYLLLGGAETTFNLDDSFERVAEIKTGFYRHVK
jgi:chemotaxis protein methyltransferase CheR